MHEEYSIMPIHCDLVICSPVNGLLDFFIIMNKPWVWWIIFTYTQIFFLFSFFLFIFLLILDIDLAVELLDHVVSIIFFQKYFIAFIYSLGVFMYTWVHVLRHTCECQDSLQESVLSSAM